MRKPVIIKFTQNELDSFIEDPNSCVTINNTTYSILLYPYHISNISESIKRLLNAKVAKYDQRLDGILLGYKNLKLITPYAALRADSCYIHADIQGEFYIFKPKVGVKLTGIVNKTSSNHIGCLVHKVFNVSVPNKNENEESWAGFEVKIGSTVVLSVTQVQLDARLPYIRASIIPTSNNLSIIEGENEKIEETPKKQKKKTSDREIELLLEEARIKKEKRKAEKIQKKLETTNLNGSMKKQKNKQKSGTVENFETLEEKTPNLSDSTKKEKKKRKSDTIENFETLEEKTLNLSDSTKKEKKKRKSETVEIFETLKVKTPNLNDSTKKEKKKRKSETIESFEALEQKTPNLDSTKKEKKKQKSEIIENPADRNEGPTKKPKKQKNKNSQLDISNTSDTQIKLEELSQKTLILNESQNKSNNLDTNKISPKKTKISNDSQRTNESDYFATPKIKKKQKQLKTPEVKANLEKGSLEDFIPKEKKTKSSSEKKKKNKQTVGQTETTVEELQNTLLNEKLLSLNEIQKKEKKRKSKERKPEKLLNLSPIKPMADLEDRKIKKRRQSLSQSVDWENKNLKLYDSDLEKTLNTPTDSNKSLEFNLAKIQALNDNTPRKRKLLPSDDFIECIDKKKMRIYED